MMVFSLEYKAGRIKFVCIAMCSLVMSFCSHDLHVTSSTISVSCLLSTYTYFNQYLLLTRNISVFYRNIQAICHEVFTMAALNQF